MPNALHGHCCCASLYAAAYIFRFVAWFILFSHHRVCLPPFGSRRLLLAACQKRGLGFWGARIMSPDRDRGDKKKASGTVDDNQAKKKLSPGVTVRDWTGRKQYYCFKFAIPVNAGIIFLCLRHSVKRKLSLYYTHRHTFRSRRRFQIHSMLIGALFQSPATRKEREGN